MSTPTMSSRELTSARALTGEMPHTLAALQDGVISGFQARVITETTTCLTPQDRAEVDERLAPHLARSTTPEISAAARGLVYEIDPAGFVRRSRAAAADRGVSLRPAPDVMALLTARLPAAQAVACHQALHEDALTRRTSGDPRTLQQLMADELYDRLTGRSVVDGIDIEIGLVMTDTALLAGTSDPADLIGYGPIPRENARDLLRPPHEAPEGGMSLPVGRDQSPVEPTSDDTGQTEPCPDGIRCTTFECTLTHGIAPRTAQPAPPTPRLPPTHPPTPAAPRQRRPLTHPAPPTLRRGPPGSPRRVRHPPRPAAARRQRPGCGCAASTPTPPASSPHATPADASSPANSEQHSSPETAPAAPPGAEPPSEPSTTDTATPTAAPPHPTTAKDSAPAATSTANDHAT